MKKSSPKRRVLREKIPADILKLAKSYSKQYGKLGLLADKTGINYPNLHTMIKDGKATPANIEKISNAIKQAA